jgi:ubiquinol-cytochrome c reductase iron-sulfur subunit
MATNHPIEDETPTRRDFMTVAALSFTGVGGAVALWPFIDQMNPHRGTPRPVSEAVDLAAIAPGETRLVAWNGKAVFVRNRLPEEVMKAQAVEPAALPDPAARNARGKADAPASDQRRTLPGHERWLVVIGLCTHLGCVLRNLPPAERLATGIGWFCPCHAARYDLSGRVVGGPAATNLPVPPYAIRGNHMVIGES